MIGRSEGDWDEVSALLRSVEADVGLVAGFSFLVPNRVLRIPANGFLNLHAGTVPEYRGGSPLNWQIANGESFAGLSVLRMTAGIDDGHVVDCERLPIHSSTTIADLHGQASDVFPTMVVRVMADLERALAHAIPQDEQNARYWHQRSDLDGRFDPRFIGTADLERLVRAVTRPYPGAWAMVGHQELRLFEVRRSEVAFCGTPGRIVRLAQDTPVVVLHDGALEVHDYRIGGSPDGLSNGMHLA
jgi:methionyl-tRNA formyltransferase